MTPATAHYALALWSDLAEESRSDPLTPWRLHRLVRAGELDLGPDPDAVLLEVCRLVNAHRNLAPVECGECHGYREVTRGTCDHQGACPCPTYEVDCPRCAGTGNEPCGCCEEPGVPGTIVVPDDASPWCPQCCADGDFGELARHARTLREGAGVA